MNYLKLNEAITNKIFFIKCSPFKNILPDSNIHWLKIFNNRIEEDYNESVNYTFYNQFNLAETLQLRKKEYFFELFPNAKCLPNYVKEAFTEYENE